MLISLDVCHRRILIKCDQCNMLHQQSYNKLGFHLPILVNVTSHHRLSSHSLGRPFVLVSAPKAVAAPACIATFDSDVATGDGKKLKIDREEQQCDSFGVTRRSFLLYLIAITAFSMAFDVAPADAYSSPYRPGQSGDTNLPKRLFDKPEDEIVYTESGLQYFDLKKGSGSEAKDGSTVSVNYTTRLRGLNGIKVQSTFDDESAPPFVFRVGDPNVVPGVNEAIIGMRVGGFRRVVVPPNLAYQSPDMKPPVTEFFARRRLLSVLRTNRDATIVFEYVKWMYRSLFFRLPLASFLCSYKLTCVFLLLPLGYPLTFLK